MSAILTPPTPSPAPSPAAMTIEEFIARYQGTNAEYVDGVVKEPHMAWMRHGKIAMRLAAPLAVWVEENDLGHVMGNDSWFRTGATKMRGGDVCFVSYERLPKGPVPDGELDVIPDIVGEVKSPSDRWGDIFIKVGEYVNAGVRVVIVIDPETVTASLYRQGPHQIILQATDTLTVPDVLPGFSIPVARFFS